MSPIRDPDVLLQIVDQQPTSTFVRNEASRFELSNPAHNQIAGAGAGQRLGHARDELHLAQEAHPRYGGGLLLESSAETGATFTAWFPVDREASSV